MPILPSVFFPSPKYFSIFVQISNSKIINDTKECLFTNWPTYDNLLELSRIWKAWNEVPSRTVARRSDERLTDRWVTCWTILEEDKVGMEAWLRWLQPLRRTI